MGITEDEANAQGRASGLAWRPSSFLFPDALMINCNLMLIRDTSTPQSKKEEREKSNKRQMRCHRSGLFTRKYHMHSTQ